jgi:glutathione S-transferase
LERETLWCGVIGAITTIHLRSPREASILYRRRNRGPAMALTLVLGNKNYSSWSFRPWIAMKVAGIPFSDRVISLNDPEFKPTLLKLSPAGKVPVLIHGDIHVWESLAILEYVAENFPDAALWPADERARAHARAICSEMHAGFVPLRRHCPMNLWRPVKHRELPDEVAANVRRIDAMWSECRERYAAGGPFLFGRFSAADAMYAPVVSRFHTYDVDIASASRRYMEAVMALPAWREWREAALKEPWVLPEDEPDWPVVLRA